MSEKCRKCGDAGWLWWFELDEYSGPASDSHDCQSDDTQYSCDACTPEERQARKESSVKT
jgi:hypothetical protein